MTGWMPRGDTAGGSFSTMIGVGAGAAGDGLRCGAIIGLFAGYIGKATPDSGLGLSALALLAGYNVSGVFAFLDELSKRVFQPTPAGQTDKGIA